MADITLKPVPIHSGLGIGFWVDLKASMATAMSTMAENDTADASSDFDPATSTIDEFLEAVDDILDSMRA